MRLNKKLNPLFTPRWPSKIQSIRNQRKRMAEHKKADRIYSRSRLSNLSYAAGEVFGNGSTSVTDHHIN